MPLSGSHLVLWQYHPPAREEPGDSHDGRGAHQEPQVTRCWLFMAGFEAAYVPFFLGARILARCCPPAQHASWPLFPWIDEPTS
jgi:hypothetical protein